jgi:hypothetical protein
LAARAARSHSSLLLTGETTRITALPTHSSHIQRDPTRSRH